MDAATANTAAARSLVAGLAANGVKHACITPGSRSTPLTVAFAEQDVVHPWLHLDERSAAFFALGVAKVTRTPAALVCTSGTASANYLPAVAEASLARVPLIVCTTDRPPRLRNVGAPQTIDQVDMFGRSVRLGIDMQVPVNGRARDGAGEVAKRAVAASLGPLPGPVHLNVPFEEPLLESPNDHPLPASVEAGDYRLPMPSPPVAEELVKASEALSRSSRPMIVAGPEVYRLPPSVARLAARIGAPLLADPLSGLRSGSHDLSHVLDSYDALFRTPGAEDHAPDLILRFGAIPTSKALGQFLERRSDITQVVVDVPDSNRDPFASAGLQLSGDADAIATSLAECAAGPPVGGAWLSGWQQADKAARGLMRDHASSFEDRFEGRVFTELQTMLPKGATIFAGNSMPVRDLDSFFFGDEKDMYLESNRGANGIDGVTSTALGMAAIREGPVVLVVGDISFYHDMNGLWAAKRHGLDLTVVLVNNDGGGIFSYLPQAEHNTVFEEWFATPPGLDPELATRLYGGHHTLARDWDTFRAAVSGRTGLNVVEVRTDRARNVSMHREAWAAVAANAWLAR